MISWQGRKMRNKFKVPFFFFFFFFLNVELELGNQGIDFLTFFSEDWKLWQGLERTQKNLHRFWYNFLIFPGMDRKFRFCPGIPGVLRKFPVPIPGIQIFRNFSRRFQFPGKLPRIHGKYQELPGILMNFYFPNPGKSIFFFNGDYPGSWRI